MYVYIYIYIYIHCCLQRLSCRSLGWLVAWLVGCLVGWLAGDNNVLTSISNESRYHWRGLTGEQRDTSLLFVVCLWGGGVLLHLETTRLNRDGNLAPQLSIPIAKGIPQHRDNPRIGLQSSCDEIRTLALHATNYSNGIGSMGRYDFSLGNLWTSFRLLFMHNNTF